MAISPHGVWSGKAPRKLPDMPQVLCFDKNPEETVAVLSEFGRRMRLPMRGMRSYARPSKHRGAKASSISPFRSFEPITTITPAAALVLAAEFEGASHIWGGAPFVANIHKWNKSVVERLWEIGFFQIVGFPDTEPRPRPDGDVTIVPMRSGMATDSDAVAKLVDDLKRLFPGAKNEAEERLLHLYGPMIEAVENAVRHAYPEKSRYWGPPSRRWWMTGAVDKRARSMTAVVYDQGVTIPMTLSDWRRFAGWMRRFADLFGVPPAASDVSKDGQVIKVAMEEAVTSTGVDYGGNGLAQMQEFVNRCREGRLRIFSRCGEYVCKSNRQPVVKTYPVPIRGTLIEWTVSL